MIYSMIGQRAKGKGQKSTEDLEYSVKQPVRGFISIFSVLIIMSILTLIAVGFSNITRRAQQRVLNDQLNVQAYYAAESGVNEAIGQIKLNPNLTKTSCQAAGDGFNYNNNLDSSLNVGYTCVLINNSDSKLVFTDIPLEGSPSVGTTDFKLSTGAAPQKFDVTWSAHSSSSSTTIPTTTSFLPSTGTGSWSDNLGLVRMDLVPTTSLDRSALATNTYSFYLYGSTQGVDAGTFQTITNGTSNQGAIIYTKDCTTNSCTAHLQLSGTALAYKMRLQSVYSQVDVTISNGIDINGLSGNWVGGQSVIDVTGKANDVFRRIQVRIPLNGNGVTASYGLQTADSICKRISATSGGLTTIESSDPVCQPDL